MIYTFACFLLLSTQKMQYNYETPCPDIIFMKANMRAFLKYIDEQQLRINKPM
jgi:hypothetical protein